MLPLPEVLETATVMVGQEGEQHGRDEGAVCES